MIPAWLQSTLIIVIGVGGLWAVSRLASAGWRRWRSRRTRASFSQETLASRANSTTSDDARAAKPDFATQDPAVAGLTTEAASSSPVDLDSQFTILKSGTRLTAVPETKPATSSMSAAHSDQSAVAANSGASAEKLVSTDSTDQDWRPAVWADLPLLKSANRQQSDLPRVLAEDVPSTRTDDFRFGGITPVLASFLPESPARFEEARRELQSAGYYEPHALQNYSAVRYLLMMAGLVFAGMFLILSPPRFEWIAMISLIMLPLLGWAAPRLLVRGKAAERRSEIERGMPDLLDMLNMCVSQGLTIPDALRRILPDLRGPYPALAQELRIVDQQAQIGSLRTALENFNQRTDIPEVHSFTSLLTQTDRMGTSISDALASYSDTMRESLKQRAEEKGNRATFRLLFPTVLCLMPAVYLFLMGPAIVELSNFFGRGGRAALDQGSSVIQRINADRPQPPQPQP